MHPHFIDLFGVELTTYGLMVAVAFASLWRTTVSRGIRIGYSPEFIQNLITVIAISAFVFARALHVLVYWDSYKSHPSEILFSRVGYVYLGGLVGAVLCSAWYTRRHGQSVFGVGDLFAPYVAMALGIGRIGCFLFGCCYGGLCSMPWAVRFPNGSPASYDHWDQGLLPSTASYSLPVHPVQLYESLFCFAHFGLLLLIRSRQRFRGQIAMCYLMFYGVGRFTIEFFRDDDRGAFYHLSTSQLISLLLFPVGLIGFFILQKKALSPNTLQEPAETQAAK